MRQFINLSAAILTVACGPARTECIILKQEVFEPQHKTAALVSKAGAPSDAHFVVFRSKLRVNTDGAPNSYHPYDPTGQIKAINTIANAITVRKSGQAVSGPEKIKVFEYFRDHDWTAPAGYQISWQNVLAGRAEGSRRIPCVFTSGQYKGYLGSLTALRNNVSRTDAGECGYADQLDARYVPALVIAGGSNPLKNFGVKTGDLLIAINPSNGVIQAAVVGDSGPADNLGEGSVALNMALLKKTRQPGNYAEAKALDTERQEMIVAIIPGSAGHKLQRPYSADNITARVADWVALHGYGTIQSFSATAQACAIMAGGSH